MDDLISRSKKGDEKAFTDLILSIKNDLYKIAKTRLNDYYDISDAIQETIIIAYSRIKNLKDNKKFKSWIIKILINECNKTYRKKYLTKKIFNKISNEKSSDEEENSIKNINSKLDFDILISSLNYDEKLIITLFYNNKYTCNEISNILNMNINTVKSKLLRSKDKIKKAYKGGGIFE